MPKSVACLILYSDGKEQQSLLLDQATCEVTIGRALNNQLVLDAPEVSRYHARLVWEQNQYLITDLHSKTGTQVNKVRIAPGQALSLTDQDIISIGSFNLCFHNDLLTEDLESTEMILDPGATNVANNIGYQTIQLNDEPLSALRVTTPQDVHNFPLKGIVITVGRDPACDISIDLPIVSARHAQIQRTEEGYEIIDLDSANGLLYQGQRIKQKSLQNGDIFQIGPAVTLTFLVDPSVDIIPIVYDSVVKSLGDGIIVLDRQHRIMDVNPSGVRILNRQKSEIVGEAISALFINQPDLLEQYRLITNTSLLTKADTYKTLPIWTFDRDEHPHHYEMHLAALRDDYNRLAGYLVVLHDITRRQQAEIELLQAKNTAESYLRALRKELEIGTQIQKEFLPQDLPERKNWEFATCFRPARDVAGDFYDIFPLPGDCIGLVVGDVSDKGVGSSLFMALFRSLIRVFAEQSYLLALRTIASSDNLPQMSDSGFQAQLAELSYTAPLKAVSLANDYIVHNHSNANMFATLFFGVLDPETGLLTYINGGHEPPIILDHQQKIKARLAPSGAAVGFLPREKYEILNIQLQPGDIFLAYTDGVTEARSPNKAFFRESRLLDLLNEPVDSAASLLGRIESQVLAYIDTANQFDDITMLAVRWLAQASDSKR
ncbi:MAG: SpoIIE family protein phosphatase [Cyanobacteriota bacterium]|nr:SpoIIE family protein phosphatase [Cyanobacteriota bacterium]